MRTFREVDAPPWDFQPVHRHAEPRLVVFLDGFYIERDFAHACRFARGDFVVRPSYYGHDGATHAEGARYLRLGLAPASARKFFARKGWKARRGRLAVDGRLLAELAQDPFGGDAVLSGAETSNLSASEARSPIEKIAAALAGENDMALEALAETHGMNPWTLTRAFRRAYGMSPLLFRLNARIERALQLIAEGASSLSAVAAQAGFADQSHLSHVVKRMIGRTPAALRREIAPG